MQSINNTQFENKTLFYRLRLALIIIILLTALLIIRIYNLQIVNHQYYLKKALDNQIYTLPITPSRGKIFDRNGNVLATNKLAFRLTLTQEKTKNITKTLQKLKQSGLINDKDIKSFNQKIKHYQKFHSIPIKYNLNEIQVAKFLISNNFIGVDLV